MAIAAIGQICSTASKTHNLAQCRALVQKAVAAKAKVSSEHFILSSSSLGKLVSVKRTENQTIFLPEASDYLAASAEESIALVEPVQQSKFVLGLQEEAKKGQISINVGVHTPTEDGKRVRNTSLWIDESGNILQSYQKLHLFDVELKDGPTLRESNSVEKGMKILPPFQTALGRVGLAICFDLRFPEISLSLARQGAEILSFPSAFTVPTGRAHWEILLRARAIETQSYVCASAQVGRHDAKRVSYGHSLIINPWGEKIAEIGGETESSEPQIATADIDLSMIQKIRREMPLLRRTDVYPEV